jgi:predicted acetyltransferase
MPIAMSSWDDILVHARRNHRRKFTALHSLMGNSGEVLLQTAQPNDAQLLSNLIQLYAYDLSEVYALSPGPDGRFFYDKLPLYWSEPHKRFPLLIRHGGELAGFVLVTLGSPACIDPRVYDVAEFFVLRRHRRFGVGRDAAFLVWDQFPGQWTVRVSEGNIGGLSFWSKTINEYTKNTATTSSRPNKPHDFKVYFFESSK